MATNSKKAVKAADAPQDAAVVVKRTRKSASNVIKLPEQKPLPEALAKKVAVKKSVAPQRSRSTSPRATRPQNSSTLSVASSDPAAAETAAQQQAAEAQPKGRRVNHDSPIGDKQLMRDLMTNILSTHLVVPGNAAFLDEVIFICRTVTQHPRLFGASTYERLIRAALSPEHIKARKPLFTGIPAAIERAMQARAAKSAAYVKPQNADEARAKADDFNAKVASGELPEGLHAVTATIEPMEICSKLVSASNRVPEALLRFPPEDRDRLTPFLSFFERFWVAIPAYFKMEHSFNAKDFSALQKQPEFESLVRVNSYARFEFSCGSRAIVLRTLVGCATFFFAENEFVDMLKKMPGALPSIIKEQAEKNKPVLTLMTSIPNGLMALVREFETETRLNLANLYRIFGDPLHMLMKVPQSNLARNVQELKLVLDVAPAAV